MRGTVSAAAPFASSAEAQRKRLHSWYTDDGENYHFAKNATGGPLCTEGIGEVGFAETPDGGILGSGRNGIFHGKGKCNCRGTVRSTDGGDSFGALGFDPVLVEPECMVREQTVCIRF